MSNRPSICWKCVHREYCTSYNKDPETEVIDCGRFIMRDVDKAIMQAIYEHFMAESELEDRPDFLKKRFNIPMVKDD